MCFHMNFVKFWDFFWANFYFEEGAPLRKGLIFIGSSKNRTDGKNQSD